MNDQILTIVIKTDTLDPSGINEWINEWSRDFFVEDYQCDIGYGEISCSIYVPVDQIRPDKFQMLKLEKLPEERRYPDTTDNPSYAIVSTFLLRASEYEATNAIYARAAKLS